MIELVHKEMNERQANGYLKKSNFSSQEKNRIAINFMDLHDRVKKDSIRAMADDRLYSFNKRELERFQSSRKAQEKADSHK